jgi:predicted Zn-dependent protease
MFVAAHEIAHVEMNHTFIKAANVTELRIRELLHSIQNRITSSLLNLDGQAPEENFRETQNKIDQGRYSQTREREADLWGARIALAAGASPQGIKDTLDRFQASRERFYNMFQGRSSADNTLDTRTLTHPLPLTRLEYLEQALGPKFWEK